MTDDPTDPRARWAELVAQELAGRDPQSLVRRRPGGLELRPLYLPEDLAGLDHLQALPGEPPFVRGARASMYAGRPWTLRQYAGFSTPGETNAFFRRALAAGQRGLSIAFDLPTHRGYDSDDARVAGDVGKAGVAVDSVEDMKTLLDGIPLGETSVSMTMNGAVLPILAAFIVAGEEQGVARAALTGTIQNDVLKEFMVRNTYIYPPEPSLRIVGDVIEYVAQELPRYNSISVSGYHMQEAGASAELELGYTLADALEYVGVAVGRGLDVNAVGRSLAFFFGIGMDFFVEIAKLRAARLLWARLLEERYGATDPRARTLRVHCQTSGVSLTAQDPLNNVVRTSFEALAAVLGGTQSLHTNAYDEALALPSEHSARVARNTQLILQHETGVGEVVDPLGGSYLVERLTRELADRARAVIEEIDAFGGMTRAIRERVPQRQIERAAAERQARIDRGEQVVVGVNRFLSSDEPELELLRAGSREVLQAQQARLTELRARRNPEAVTAALAALTRAAGDRENLLARSVDAMRARATVGEVSAALEQVFGRHEATATSVSGVYSRAYADDAEWAELVRAVGAFAAHHGRQPRILLCKLGQDGHDRGVKVVAAGLVDLGFDVELGPLFQSPEQAARQASAGDAHFVGVSTQAGGHLTFVPELLSALAREGATDIRVVVGGIVPAADRAALEAAGAAAVFGPGTTVIAIARRLLELAGPESASRAPGSAR